MFDLLFICLPVLFEKIIGFCLRGGVGVRVVEEILDAEEDLFDSDCGFPSLFFVED